MEKLRIKTVNVSEKGQIALPVEIRKSMNIKKGDRLLLMQADNKVLIEKSEVIEKLKDDFKDILKFNELALKEVWDNKEDDIWQEYLK